MAALFLDNLITALNVISLPILHPHSKIELISSTLDNIYFQHFTPSTLSKALFFQYTHQHSYLPKNLLICSYIFYCFIIFFYLKRSTLKRFVYELSTFPVFWGININNSPIRNYVTNSIAMYFII